MLQLTLQIAWRYIAQYKGTIATIVKLAVAATAMSVAFMIISVSIVGGFNKAIQEKLFGFSGHVHVSYFDVNKGAGLTEAPITLNKTLIDSIKRLPHVVNIHAFAERPVIVANKGKMEGVHLKGVDAQFKLPSAYGVKGIGINYTDTTYAKEIILSQTTARLLEVNLHDTVLIEFFENNGLPRLRRVKVAGIFHTGMDEVDKYYAITDIRLLQHINHWNADSINGYQIAVDDNKYAPYISDYIHYKLIQAPLESYTTVENYPNIFDWLKMQDINSLIILIIMAVVSIVNMGVVVLILMVDRASMIGLFTVMGMESKTLTGIFVGMAGFIAGVGILIGNIIGLGFCYAQQQWGLIKLPEETYYMRYAPIAVDPLAVIGINIVTLLLCMLCVLLPALYIKQLTPAKALNFK